jgi:polyphosphate glucokinase
MNVLVIDVGGSHIKILATGHTKIRRVSSGPDFTASAMVASVIALAHDWDYDVISLGYPGPVLHNRPVADPHNLAPGWVCFDFAAALQRPVKIINDAAMQALGSYKDHKLLFLGLGTGLGSAMVVNGHSGPLVEPMELGHLPYRKGTYEDYVGQRGLDKRGRKKWRKHVADVVERLTEALQPEEVVLGGGNVKHLKEMPPGCRPGSNAYAFAGGFRLWPEAAATPAPPSKRQHSL